MYLSISEVLLLPTSCSLFKPIESECCQYAHRAIHWHRDSLSGGISLEKTALFPSLAAISCQYHFSQVWNLTENVVFVWWSFLRCGEANLSLIVDLGVSFLCFFLCLCGRSSASRILYRLIPSWNSLYWGRRGYLLHVGCLWMLIPVFVFYQIPLLLFLSIEFLVSSS